MIDARTLDDLAAKLADSIPPQLKDMQKELGDQFKTLLQSNFAKMDLVSREEFDAQTRVLLRTREKLEALELLVAELEASAKSQSSS